MRTTLILDPISRYDQVLTGVLPYGISDWRDVLTCIKCGKRPSRPTDPVQNQWLHDPVWDMITTCWSDKPKRRCKLPAVYHVFSTSSLQNTEPNKPGDLNVQIKRNPTIAKRSQTSEQGYGSVENSSQESPLSSSFCKGRSQKLIGELMKWIRQVVSSPPVQRLM
jgi:hypothetical protein